MSEETEKFTFPDLDKFQIMSRDDRVSTFLRLPVVAQKLLVGVSAFASSVRPEMALPVSRLNNDEFQAARTNLLHTPYFSEVEGRLTIAEPIRVFINTELKQFWEEQKNKK